MVDFGRLPGRAEENGGRPQFGDAVDGDHELHPIGHHEGNPMAGRHTPAGQMVGKGVAQSLQIAEGPRFVPAANGHAIPEAVGRPFQALVHEERGHWKHSSLN